MQTPPPLRTITAISFVDTPDVIDRMVALNNEHHIELSWADPTRMRYLVERSSVCETVGNVEAFLLAMDQDADYDSVNFRWFKARYSSFMYVDRVVTAVSARGLGHGRLLYQRLIATAENANCERIVCEVNLDPPNPASEKFHAAFGFQAITKAELPDRRS